MKKKVIGPTVLVGLLLLAAQACSGAEFTIADQAEADSGAPDTNSENADAGQDAAEADADVGTDAGDSGTKPDVVDAEAGSDAGILTCTGGKPGTVDQIVLNGMTDAKLLVHYRDGSEPFLSANPVNVSTIGQKMPGQAIGLGLGSLSFTLKSSDAPVKKPWYIVDLTSLGAIAGCDGSDIQKCLSGIGKSFRCQTAPYLETSSCPAPAAKFWPQAAASSYSNIKSGWQIVVIDLTCP